MLFRDRRINFRLTPKEEQQFEPLIKGLHCSTWSDLCRLALHTLWEQNPGLGTSDNGVRQERSPVSDALPLFAVKKKKKVSKKKVKKPAKIA